MASFQQGKYKATIEKWGLGESKEKKTPCVFFVIIPQQVYDKTTGEWLTVEPSERRIDMWLTEKTIEFVSRDLVKLGYPHDTFDQLNPEHPKKHDFYGQEIDVQCKHEPYTANDGTTKQGEKWSLAFEGGSSPVPEALESKGVRALNALFGKQLKDYRKKVATDKKDVAQEKVEDAATEESMNKQAAEVF